MWYWLGFALYLLSMPDGRDHWYSWNTWTFLCTFFFFVLQPLSAHGGRKVSAASYLLLSNKLLQNLVKERPSFHLLITLRIIILDWTQLDGSSIDLGCPSCGILGPSGLWHSSSHVWQMMLAIGWATCLQQASLVFFWWLSSKSSKRKASTQCISAFQASISSHLLNSHWPKQVIWLRLTSMWEGTAPGCVYKETWFWGAAYC